MALGTVAVRAGGKKPKSERLQLATRCVSAAVAAAAAAAVRQWRTFSIVSPPTAPPPPRQPVSTTRRHSDCDLCGVVACWRGQAGGTVISRPT